MMTERLDATRMNEIVRERRRITPDTAERLARYFSMAPQFWVNLQIQYDRKQFEASEEAAEFARQVQPRKGARGVSGLATCKE